MRSTFSGSGMMTKSVRPLRMRPVSARYATPAKPPLSSSAVPLISTVPGSVSPARAIASTANTEAAIPAFMSHTPRPKILPSFTRPPNGSTVQPSPAGTTSMCPLRWTTGPGPLRRVPTTLMRGWRTVCSARPSAAMYSTSNERRARSSPRKCAQASYSSPGGLMVGILTRSTVNPTISSAARSTSVSTRSMGSMVTAVYNIAIMKHPVRSWLLLPTAMAVLGAAQPGSTVANATLTAVPGIKVGHQTLTERPTGCTAVVIDAGATAGVDVRGAAPATRDTDLLDPAKMVQQIFGISLSGGSPFGLSTADGVLRYLEEKKVGIAYGGRRIPIVPGASIFDLAVGDAGVRPTADCGYRAAQAASAAAVVEGSVGAGAGATLGKYGGIERAMKSGVGSAAVAMPDGLIVAALVVANPLGDVIDPATGHIVAGVRAAAGSGLADARALVRSGTPRVVRSGGNSTIGVVATNAR